jgi:hypothetical protein
VRLQYCRGRVCWPHVIFMRWRLFANCRTGLVWLRPDHFGRLRLDSGAVKTISIRGISRLTYTV